MSAAEQAEVFVTDEQMARWRDHADALDRHELALSTGRQPRYFTHGRPGIEETRGVPFAPKPKRR